MNLNEFKSVDIPLPSGGFASIDIADAPKALQYRWHQVPSGSRLVAYARSNRVNGKRVYLHRLVMDATETQIDHKDGNGLNNRRANLRHATATQNKANTGLRADNTVGVKGVYRRANGTYVAQITINRKNRHLGVFSTVEEGSAAYEAAARQCFGEFARWAKQS